MVSGCRLEEEHQSSTPAHWLPGCVARPSSIPDSGTHEIVDGELEMSFELSVDVVRQSPHSALSAMMGSTRVARRAGRQQATSPKPTSAPPTAEAAAEPCSG